MSSSTNQQPDHESGSARNLLWFVPADLFGLWLVLHVVFFSLCNAKCLRSFLGTETVAAQYTFRTRWDNRECTVNDDRMRALTLTRLHSSYLRLFHEEARVWVRQNWSRWEAESPA